MSHFCYSKTAKGVIIIIGEWSGLNMTKKVRKLKDEQMTINKCLKKFILLSQIFGYFPVSDISKSTQKFTYKSFKMAYSIFSAIGPAFLCIMQVKKAITVEFNLFQVEYVTKYITSTYVAVSLIQLGQKWPKLMEEWREVEIEMKDYGFPKKLSRQINGVTMFFMTTFIVEYALHQTSRIYRVMECHHDPDQAIKFFFGNLTLSHVFQYIPYNIPTSLVFQFWFCQMEFVFTYTDIFVMVISLCLAGRMKQVTQRIKMTSEQQIADEKVWRELRKDYTRLGNLCRRVNNKISNIILISFLPNVFTILIQVYNSLKPKQNDIETVYFYASLIFLISRTATVCICGAMINEESRRPLNILNTVSHKIYNNEIEIFITQISNCEISLNGKHFFNIKRHVILEIAGALVTYELVLIQFNQEYLYPSSKSSRCN